MPIWILTALSPQELMPSEQPLRLKSTDKENFNISQIRPVDGMGK